MTCVTFGFEAENEPGHEGSCKSFGCCREYFEKQKFTEVSPPMFISAAVEGGSTLFGLKYFDQDLYLTQSSANLP